MHRKRSQDSEDTDPSSGSYESDGVDSISFFDKLQSYLSGLRRDWRHRMVPHYKHDWKIPSLQVLNASVYAFVIQFIPALIFGFLLEQQTGGKILTSDVLLSSGVIGMLYAIFSGQPMTLIGISGPVALLLGASHGLAQEYFGANYYTFFWWTCIWTSLLHVLSAMFGVVDYAWIWITPFTSQIFELFIAISFLYQAIRELITPLHLLHTSTEEQQQSVAYATLLIGLLTFAASWKLHFAETWVYFSRQKRTFLGRYSLLIVFVAMTGISYLPGVAQRSGDNMDGIQRIRMNKSSWAWNTILDRAAVRPMDDIDVKGIFGALIPATMIYILFFMEHNMASAMAQAPKYKLQKPSAFHWDFMVLGLTIIPCAFFGLPPGCGLRPQAPLHTRALCSKTKIMSRGFGVVDREIVTHCAEQRWSALLQAMLILASLYLVQLISCIPVGCLFGALLYMGVSTLYSSSIWTRISLMAMPPKKRPNIPIVTKVYKWKTVQQYTAIQLVLGGATFAIAFFTKHGYIFPALIAVCMPLRRVVLPRIFSSDDMKFLDPEYETEESHQHENHEIQAASRRPSMDESDLFHGVSEFHRSYSMHEPEECKSPQMTIEIDPDEATTASQHQRCEVDPETGSVQTLRKIRSRTKVSEENGFLSSWNVWTKTFLPGSEGWFGIATTATKDSDDLVIRSSRSGRSEKSEVYDVDDVTLRSARSEATDELALRSMRSTGSELFDADAMIIRSTRTGDYSSDDRRSSRGQQSTWNRELQDLGKEEKKLNLNKSPILSLRSKRKTGNKQPSGSDLEFDADRVIVPESILKSKSIAKEATSSKIEFQPNVMFAPDAETREYDADKVMMPALKQSTSEHLEL